MPHQRSRARTALAVVLAGVLAAGCAAPAPAPEPAANDRYRAAVVAEADAFQSATRTLTDAVRAGDVAAAKAAYVPAHRRYVALEPLAEDLDTRIDGRTDTGRATWTGFHRIEKALWADGSLAGMTGYANALDLDVLALRQVVGRASYRPVDVAKTANDLLTACVVTMVTGTEERWAHTDLDDLAAAVGAAYGAYAALRPERHRLRAGGDGRCAVRRRRPGPRSLLAWRRLRRLHDRHGRGTASARRAARRARGAGLPHGGGCRTDLDMNTSGFRP